VATPIGGVHCCPACGATAAERRTPRGLGERLRAALTGRRPYRCLRCRRRFYDRPATPAGAASAATASQDAAGSRRETHWYVEMRASGVRPKEIYLTMLALMVVAVVASALLIFLLWPDAVSVVQRGH